MKKSTKAKSKASGDTDTLQINKEAATDAATKVPKDEKAESGPASSATEDGKPSPTQSSSSANSKPSSATNSTSPRPHTRIARVIALLSREGGATLAELSVATGWQVHSVRAALTGLKKKGHAIARFKRDDVSCYRIEGEA